MLLNNELFSCVFSTPLCLAGLSHILLMGQFIPLGSELFPGHGLKLEFKVIMHALLHPLNLLLKHIQSWKFKGNYEAIILQSFSRLCLI